MSDPTITDYPGTIPGKSQSQAAFDTNVDAFLNWLTATNVPEYKLLAIWIRARVLEVAATAMSGDLPSITGQAGKALAVNSASDAVEFVTVPATPTTVTGVGQFQNTVSVFGEELFLPAGGTWAYALQVYNSSGQFIETYGTVAAGGSSIYGPAMDHTGAGFIWRIA